MPPRKSEKSGNSASGAIGGIKPAIEAVVQLGLKAIERDSPLSAKIFVLAIVVVPLALPTGTLLIYKDHYVAGLTLCLSAIALLLTAIIMFGFYYRESGTMQSLPTPLREWHRNVPICTKFREKDLDELGTQLEAIRIEAFEFLRKQYSNLQNEHVQAVIFLPRFDSVEKAVVCTLYIPSPKLRKQLYRKQEWDFEMRPGEGVSGDVFLNNKIRIEPRAYGLLDSKQLAAINPDLKWIAGLPLNHPRTKETMGALNVNGLVSDCDDALLAQMIDVIQKPVDSIAHRLAELPQGRISIRVDEL